MKGLNGKSVIVTGGASGIGGAAVQQLVEAGCKVTIADLKESDIFENKAIADAASDGRLQFVKTDVSDEASVQAMVASAISAYGRLDAAINAAGISSATKNIHEMTAEDWDRCNNVVLRGMFFCLKYELGAMHEAGHGAIVTISSVASIKPVPRMSPYCAAKAGVNALTQCAALEYSGTGIRVNGIMPGSTETPLQIAERKINPALEDLVHVLPIKRMGQPHEVAAGAVWLISDHASYVTGTVFPVDGGLQLI